jgi:hypothetical protein
MNTETEGRRNRKDKFNCQGLVFQSSPYSSGECSYIEAVNRTLIGQQISK